MPNETSEPTLPTNRVPDAPVPGCHLADNHLPSSHLPGSDLPGSDLRGSDLRGSDLREPGLSNATALPSIPLKQGLPVADVQHYLHLGCRIEDTGSRILAYYLLEMEERRLYQLTGHSSASHYSRETLDMDRRRTAELIAVGRKLCELPQIDQAFRDGELSWSKVLLLARVTTAEHEDAWLCKAKESTCRELALEVKLVRPGHAPRDPQNRKGLPEVSFRLNYNLKALAFQKWELVKERLSAERGERLADEDCLEVLSELFLSLEEDGTVPGRKKVASSLYRIIVHEKGATGGGHTPHRELETEAGRIPISEAMSQAIACDAEFVDAKGLAMDQPTPASLRKCVLDRDGHRCRSCGSRLDLMVHHIHFRSKGGRTNPDNLISLCTRCHALVHEDLLVLIGVTQGNIRFVDRSGSPREKAGAGIGSSIWTQLLDGPSGAPRPSQPLLTLEQIPDRVDADWWRRHVDLISLERSGDLRFRPGRPQASAPRLERTSAIAPLPRSHRPTCFSEMRGQNRVVETLSLAVKAAMSRDRLVPHCLFTGAPGTGKTTLARVLASECGAELHTIQGPQIEDVAALLRILTQLGPKDLLFIDEIHAVPSRVLEVLYEAMEDRSLSLVLRTGPRARTLTLDLPPFTLVGATTEAGRLPPALRSRFTIHEVLDGYREQDLARVIQQEVHREGHEIDPDTALHLATLARGTPRDALHLTRRILIHADAEAWPKLDRCKVEGALRAAGYDEQGLLPIEQRYLSLLRSTGRPIALSRLAQLLGIDAESLTQSHEPWLIQKGLLEITPQGRVPTSPRESRTPNVRRFPTPTDPAGPDANQVHERTPSSSWGNRWSHAPLVNPRNTRLRPCR